MPVFFAAERAVVHRGSYAGAGHVAANASFATDADARGYLPVEWWIMSATEARNPEPLAGEGLTRLRLPGRAEPVPLRDCADELLGEFAGRRWPLVKVLDIGCAPIPAHVHGGDVVDGAVVSRGKLEAYYFPPSSTAPGARTWLGLRPGTSAEELLAAVAQFGESDAVYGLLNEFEAAPGDGWTILPGVVHAPGPTLTIEMQLPQDDYNLLAWVRGQPIADDAARALERERSLLRGCPDCAGVLDAVVDVELSATPDFERRFRRREDADGRIFFGEFEAYVVRVSAGGSVELAAEERPSALLAWSGAVSVGPAGGTLVGAQGGEPPEGGCSEALVTARTAVSLSSCSDSDDCVLFRFFPLSSSS